MEGGHAPCARRLDVLAVGGEDLRRARFQRVGNGQQRGVLSRRGGVGQRKRGAFRRRANGSQFRHVQPSLRAQNTVPISSPSSRR